MKVSELKPGEVFLHEDKLYTKLPYPSGHTVGAVRGRKKISTLCWFTTTVFPCNENVEKVG